MLRYTVLFFLFAPTTAYAASAQGEISAFVSPPPAIMNADGTIPANSAQPLYCDNGLCYF